MRGQLRGLEAACAGEVHAALVARLATLETEHAALARDADAQRRQYERCLDDVANQVVRALLSQKVHLLCSLVNTHSSIHIPAHTHTHIPFFFSSSLFANRISPNSPQSATKAKKMRKINILSVLHLGEGFYTGLIYC